MQIYASSLCKVIGKVTSNALEQSVEFPLVKLPKKLKAQEVLKNNSEWIFMFPLVKLPKKLKAYEVDTFSGEMAQGFH